MMVAGAALALPALPWRPDYSVGTPRPISAASLVFQGGARVGLLVVWPHAFTCKPDWEAFFSILVALRGPYLELSYIKRLVFLEGPGLAEHLSRDLWTNIRYAIALEERPSSFVAGFGGIHL